ncbi:Uncharacterized membrane protein YcaP, DUF421 family [Lentibacillus halodurans]|uniref:Uncharacterized membrane protein YcaP, DUF421 family n=1 Tax=Lentibacillus halodurans TaxID=237679 RepID=A0A1I0W845_9BACI|nr:DUF421 domain-containing protein [Lentibacillus halodurans]SFA84882.1 Uncharacterized membrane protein YcaP, DUF421 family [Lentibacillus halodurans]
MNISELVLRIVLSFIVLFILARIMGRKEISQMTFFNFISAIAIGSISANLVVSQNLSIRNGLIAMVGWAMFTIVMGFIDIKSKSARKIMTGQPLIVVKDGKIMENALRKARLDINSLNALLRQKNIFAMSDVNYAIFETSGKLSVLKKENKRTVTKGDMNITNPIPTPYPIGTEVISDGRVNTNNLSALNLDMNWLEQQVGQAGAKTFSQIFYAEVQPDGTLYVDKKDDAVE